MSDEKLFVNDKRIMMFSRTYDALLNSERVLCFFCGVNFVCAFFLWCWFPFCGAKNVLGGRVSKRRIIYIMYSLVFWWGGFLADVWCVFA